ncbi:CoA transferase, CAIB/BAIF family protein [Minicystis rosea]|nr:CoA transferase, CAIB/BAIF family protein [Minicystis rosea]
MSHPRFFSTAEALWLRLAPTDALLDRLVLSGPEHVLPSVFDVTGFAAATVGVTTLAAAELLAARRGGPVPAVAVDSVHASASFLSEALFTPIDWERPAIWDPIAGDYRAADRWIRLHTNYASHRAAVLRVLRVPAERSAVEAAVARCDAAVLESAVVAAGGCAAVMYRRDEWDVLPQGRAVADAPPIAWEDAGAAPVRLPALSTSAADPLAGVRVLDLTRVIAGPECTRFLAAHGAEVLRIDPPGFEEVPALLPETTAGKRCASLDLTRPADRERFEALVRRAHVIVHGFRPGALEGLGLDEARLRAWNPSVVLATLDAYGWAGPWQQRRGFDSLVQMSTGIAAAGAAARGVDRPTPLPAQALDHGIGYLLAAGVCRALTRLATMGAASNVRGSLVGAANALMSGPPGDPSAPSPRWPPDIFEACTTSWGSARRVRCPGTIAGEHATWSRPAGPLGRDEPTFD